MNLQQKIQLILCITFIGIEIKFIPIITSTEIYYFFQEDISFSFIILTTYYQFIYSFIAYKLFTAPKDLSKFYNKFFIYIFPCLLFFFLALFVNLYSGLTLYFKFIAYPGDPEIGPTQQSSKRLSLFCRIIFFFLNILYTILLLIKIRQVIKKDYNNN